MRPTRPSLVAPSARPARSGGSRRRGAVGLLVVVAALGALAGVGPVAADPVGDAPGVPGTPGSASITVVQAAPGGTDFAFTVTGRSDFVLDDDSDPVFADRTTLTDLAAGTYTVTQAVAAGWALDALTCDGVTAVDVATRTATITVAAGDQVTCTFTNVPAGPPTDASLTVVLDAHDRQDFEVTVSGLTPFVLDDDHDPRWSNSALLGGLAPGTYTVTPTPEPGWRLVSLTCTGAQPAAAADRGATVVLEAGDRAVCTVSVAAERPLVGAIRWDAWHDGPVGRAVEHTLGPEHWRTRLPWFAEVTGPGTVRTRADNQAVADREIELAADLGLDYFAFLWYDSDREVGSEDEGMMRGLRLYRASPARDLVKYTVIIDGQRLGLPAERAAVVDRMQDPNWVKVDGRPLLFTGMWYPAARADVDALRAASIAQGTGDPYVVHMVVSGNDHAQAVEVATGSGADAVTWYAAGVTSAAGAPYAALARGVRTAWDQVSARGAAVVPTVMTGWDPRPRVERPPFWGGSGPNWYQPPTPAELATEFATALTWAGQRGAPAVIAYAWNEYDEGGWLAPTLVPEVARTDAVRDALARRSAPTVSVGDAVRAEGPTDTTTTLQFPVTLSRAAEGPVMVEFTTEDGTATSPDDFVAATGSLTFAPGETTATVEVIVRGDADVEPDETVTLRLARASGAWVHTGTARGTILNDDGVPAAPPATFVSDLPFVSARNGFGPVERNLANGNGGAGDGPPLVLAGRTYTRGLGTHANSTVTINLRAGDVRFVADVGVDDVCGSAGSVVFQVQVDGAARFTSPLLTGSSPTVRVDVPVTGGRQLTLRVSNGGDGSACDHADWADARLEAAAATPPTTTPPTTTPPTTTPPTTTLPTTTLPTTTPPTTTLPTTTLPTTTPPTTTPPTTTPPTTTPPTTTPPTTTPPTTTPPTTTPPPVTGTFLSDLVPVSARNGFGPVERDRSNGSGAAGDGRPITLNGVVHAKGLGTHADATVTYAVGTSATTFVADVGVDDVCGASGSVVFQVLVDGVTRYTSPVLRGSSETQRVVVDVRGARRLVLRVTNAGDGSACDHADWGSARLL
jgi:hypothetical protein